MRKIIKSLLYLVIATSLFTACNPDDENPTANYENVNGYYFINYGGSSVGPSTVTRYDFENDTVINNYYEAQNGTEMTSNVQYMYKYNESIYMMGNDNDQIIVVDTAFVESDVITDSVATPRYCISDGTYLYVSNWGPSPDWYLMADSYISVYDISTNTFVKKINLAGGPEGLAIANGNLYAALNYTKSVAVIDLDDYSISYIETPAVSSYFVKDANDNLYVSLVSTYTYRTDNDGLGYINTNNNTLEETYEFTGISSNYASIMNANEDYSIIYIVAAPYDWDTYTSLGVSLQAFDVASGTFTTLIDEISGTNGVVYNEETDELYVFGGSYSADGTIAVYSTDGTLKDEFACGVSPYWSICINYEE